MLLNWTLIKNIECKEEIENKEISFRIKRKSQKDIFPPL
jgi:hypothetical protein